MTLGQLLTPAQIIPELKGRDRWSVLQELTGRLFELDLVPEDHRPTILKRLCEREELITTGIGAGVAIPHALCPYSRHIIAAFGRSREGVDFDAMDQAPVHIVVLFIVPETNYRLRLETLSAIGKTLSHRDVRDRLMEAESVERLHLLLSGRPDSKTPQLHSEGVTPW